MRAKAVLVALAAIAVAVALIVAIASNGDDGPGGARPSQGLPPVEGHEPPTDYRIIYQVTTIDAVAEEEHVVHRPFVAHVVNRDASGAVTADRWSDLGILVTRSQGAEAVRIDTAIAPSASDLRPERFSARLAEAGKVTVAEDESSVGGRRCRSVEEADTVPGEGGETVPVTIDRCVDALGLVLQEVWTTDDGDVVLTKRARLLELGDDVPAVEVPRATPLPAEQGNGAVRKVADDEVPPFQEAFALDVPDGFTFVGRYAVAPARLSSAEPSAPQATPSDLALYTDVWRRGPDLLLLDQGATKGGSTPFTQALALGNVDLGALGQGELAADLRSAEVHMARPDGGFVRVSGTIPLDELVALATSSLHVLEEVAR